MLLDRQEQLPTKKTMQKLREMTRSIAMVDTLRTQGRMGWKAPPSEGPNVYGITFERQSTRDMSAASATSATSASLKGTAIGGEEGRPASPAKASYTP
jgi:hypothetical protein